MFDPLEVQRQQGAFDMCEWNPKLEDYNKVESWRKALAEASNVSGWTIDYNHGMYEASGIQLIVKKISNILYPDKDHIGLQTRLVDIKYGGSGMNTIPFPPSSHEDLEHLRVPLQEISSATNNFSKNNIIAVGGFGKVYQGLSEQHGTIAVKQLDRRHGQGEHEFMMEIALLSVYKHENIVSLDGFCDQDGEKILVMKYEVNGSLDKHIHGKDLTWIQRLRICLDVANGLKYLHEDVGAQQRILHRDIKSSNILLDENWKAKISDFGLSKVALANVPCSVIISRVCGTMGYVDPEYHGHNILTQKSDVYSFGVVLFEVLCSRSVNARQYHFSAQLAQNHYEKETLDEIIDSGLRSQMNLDSLSTYSTIAYQCIKKRRDERPTMGFAVDQLEKALDYQQVSYHKCYSFYPSLIPDIIFNTYHYLKTN
ncbi:putative receptor-like protein kinase At5g38990 [Bidens hawaiensis]|uniref:putative receptor-like protein kinase At5g38990 n=1 Tax=Bidens hawaiensis TaxID=980011 RepID=UPI00404A784A